MGLDRWPGLPGQCETHVAHHLCSAIPHYNAWEATEALKEKLGSYYLYDDRNMFLTLYRSASSPGKRRG